MDILHEITQDIFALQQQADGLSPEMILTKILGLLLVIAQHNEPRLKEMEERLDQLERRLDRGRTP